MIKHTITIEPLHDTIRMPVAYSFLQSRFGTCLVASTDRGICAVLFEENEKHALTDLQTRLPNAKFTPKRDQAHNTIIDFIENRTSTIINLHIRGTPFQMRVWQQLVSIPFGETSTYAEVAKALATRGYQAVGSAIGDNPVGFVIPCHRVLNKNGSLGGYRWGIERKKAMLAYEATLQSS